MQCPKCGKWMISTSLYDPEGTIPLETIKDENGKEWGCLNCIIQEVSSAL